MFNRQHLKPTRSSVTTSRTPSLHAFVIAASSLRGVDVVEPIRPLEEGSVVRLSCKCILMTLFNNVGLQRLLIPDVSSSKDPEDCEFELVTTIANSKQALKIIFYLNCFAKDAVFVVRLRCLVVKLEMCAKFIALCRLPFKGERSLEQEFTCDGEPNKRTGRCFIRPHVDATSRPTRPCV